MRIATGILSFFFLAIMAVYLLDMLESVDLINFHEIVPLSLFGVLWGALGIAIILPMHNAWQEKEKD